MNSQTVPPHNLFFADLERRGITPEQAEQACLRYLPNARDALRDFELRSATAIPYHNPNGTPMMFERGGEQLQFGRVRYLCEGPASFSQKKQKRYDQPKGSPVFSYFARGFPWESILNNVASPLFIVEGEYKALKACLHGYPTIGLGGVFNFKRDGEFLPELESVLWKGRSTFIIFDSDAATNHDVQLAERRLSAELFRRGAKVHIVRLPDAADGSKLGVDDYILHYGESALANLVSQTKPADQGALMIQEGTDPEIASAVLLDLGKQYHSDIVFCEGHFFAYCGTHWTALGAKKIKDAILRYNTLRFKKGSTGLIKLTDARCKSILSLMENEALREDYFDCVGVGINCASGFVRFSSQGEPTLHPHSQKHRQRHCLPGSWYPGANQPGRSLLNQLLQGCFSVDEDKIEKIALLEELCGVVALGLATEIASPKAVVMYGQTANNGKSELIEMIKGLLPKTAVCAVPPTKFTDQAMLINLVGKRLNACAELGTAKAVGSDVFKSVVTGDQVSARQLYERAFFFRPNALQLFATNTLPSFQGGFDRGLQRRLIVLTFNRSIPRSEQIASLGSRVAMEEPDALLEIAVRGAQRLLKQGCYTEPSSSKKALTSWMQDADSVLAWMSERLVFGPGVEVTFKLAYADYCHWAEQQGYRSTHLPTKTTFSRRISSQDKRLTTRRSSHERFICGAALVGSGGLG